MRFDDRLLTVLNQPAEDRHDAAVRWRQLVDLVARAGPNASSPVISDALRAIRNEAATVDQSLRAAAARAIAGLPLPSGLLEYFVSDSVVVSAPILAAANIAPVQWARLKATADEETRTFIEALHPELAGNDQATADESPDEGELPTSGAYVPPALRDVVERIEERRRLRSKQAAMARVEDRPSPTGSPALFRWECGPNGEIAWVDGAPRAALIGRSIARPIEGDGDRVDQDVVRAFGLRAPFRDASMTLQAGGSASGEWKISGVPAFDPADGRFAGYRGIALREASRQPSPPTHEPGTIPEILADPASLRELVHEIKTPLNAIIGFAEIIEGQYLGPADRGYRNRACEIVRQARLLLAAIDDLDCAAKLHSAGGGGGARVDLAALVDRQTDQLRELAEKRGVHVQFVISRFAVPATIEPELAERLLSRLFGALVDLSERGEALQIAVELSSDRAALSVSRPIALRRISEAELFGGAVESGHGGFMLRLARGLARIAGGDLVAGLDSLALIFPRA